MYDDQELVFSGGQWNADDDNDGINNLFDSDPEAITIQRNDMHLVVSISNPYTYSPNNSYY
jgi:hypothetical protein